MATIQPYTAADGTKRYRVRYRVGNRQTSKRGFRTKREAQEYLSGSQVAQTTGTYVAPSAGRVTVGEQVRHWRAGSWFDRAVIAAGCPDGFHPHELRHTAASLAISTGANVLVVQKMLGHASAAMTLDTYADLFPDDLEAVADALDAARARQAR